MTIKELYSGLKTLGYPVAYSHFSEGNVPNAPYIVYYCQGSDNFAADGIVYYLAEDINIELYTEKKDEQAEKKISDFLTKNGIFFDKKEYYIESEDLIQIVFEI